MLRFVMFLLFCIHYFPPLSVVTTKSAILKRVGNRVDGPLVMQAFGRGRGKYTRVCGYVMEPPLTDITEAPQLFFREPKILSIFLKQGRKLGCVQGLMCNCN